MARYLGLWRTTTDDLVKLCVCVRVASAILHELVHDYGYPWAIHLDNGCLDPCNMVQTGFLWAMGRRWPCLEAVPCCRDAVGTPAFMSLGSGYSSC